MIIALNKMDPRDFLSQYLERRTRAANKVAKSQIHGSPHLDRLAEVHAGKIASVNLALELGVAQVSIDDTCNPTDVSIRFGNRPTAHLPASQLRAKVHDMIIAEAAKLAGIDVRAA